MGERVVGQRAIVGNAKLGSQSEAKLATDHGGRGRRQNGQGSRGGRPQVRFDVAPMSGDSFQAPNTGGLLRTLARTYRGKSAEALVGQVAQNAQTDAALERSW
jgi:hypothetical protein